MSNSSFQSVGVEKILDPCRQPHQEPFLWIGVILILVICLIILFLVTRRFRENPKKSNTTSLIPLEEPFNPVTSQLGASVKRNQIEGDVTTTGQSTSVKSGQSNWVEGSVNHRNGTVFGNHGSIACEKQDNRFWGYANQTNRCICMSPFYGQTCQLESYDQSFYAVGTVSSSHFSAQMETVPANNLSFDTQGIRSTDTTFETLTKPNCTNICLADPSCAGVYYQKTEEETTCQLLHSVPILNQQYPPTISRTVQPNLFLRKGIYPETPDQAFLFSIDNQNNGDITTMEQMILRPWMQPDQAPGLYFKSIVTPYTVTRLDFYPSAVINNTGKQLIISNSADLFDPIVITSSPRMRNVKITWTGPVYSKLL